MNKQIQSFSLSPSLFHTRTQIRHTELVNMFRRHVLKTIQGKFMNFRPAHNFHGTCDLSGCMGSSAGLAPQTLYP